MHYSKAGATEVKWKQADYYNQHAKQRQRLEKGQTVRVKLQPKDGQWKKEEITEVLPHRSFEVRFDEGSTKRQTSRYVRFSTERPIIYREENDVQPPRSAQGRQGSPSCPQYQPWVNDDQPPASVVNDSQRSETPSSDANRVPPGEKQLNARRSNEPYKTRFGLDTNSQNLGF